MSDEVDRINLAEYQRILVGRRVVSVEEGNVSFGGIRVKFDNGAELLLDRSFLVGPRKVTP